MVTYGDMMTLLLCFFVMIVAMSEIKKDERFQKVVDSLREQFGYNTSLGTAPTSNPPDVAPIKRKLATANEQEELDQGFSTDDSPIGKHDTVQTIREGLVYTVGCVVLFQQSSADLPPSATAPLMQIAEKIRGLEHKIRLIGHTSAAPLPADSKFTSHMQLSVARSYAVYEWLIGTSENQGRIDPRRITVGGAGKYEPVVARAYEQPLWIKNDRVDVVMIEALASEYEGESVEDTLLSLRDAN